MTDHPTTHRVYDALVVLRRRLGHSPTRDEIAREVNLSRTTVQHHLKRLADWGWVSLPANGQRRALVVVPASRRRAS